MTTVTLRHVRTELALHRLRPSLPGAAWGRPLLLLQSQRQNLLQLLNPTVLPRRSMWLLRPLRRALQTSWRQPARRSPPQRRLVLRQFLRLPRRLQVLLRPRVLEQLRRVQRTSWRRFVPKPVLLLLWLIPVQSLRQRLPQS